ARARGTNLSLLIAGGGSWRLDRWMIVRMPRSERRDKRVSGRANHRRNLINSPRGIGSCWHRQSTTRPLDCEESLPYQAVDTSEDTGFVLLLDAHDHSPRVFARWIGADVREVQVERQQNAAFRQAYAGNLVVRCTREISSPTVSAPKPEPRRIPAASAGRFSSTLKFTW